MYLYVSRHKYIEINVYSNILMENSRLKTMFLYILTVWIFLQLIMITYLFKTTPSLYQNGQYAYDTQNKDIIKLYRKSTISWQ